MPSLHDVLNETLVTLFNRILKIEEQSLRYDEFRDLSVTEIHTIEAIGLRGQKTMSEVAAKLEITVGTLTTAITRLVKKGYAERERREDDRRVVRVKLTKKGQLVYRLHEKYHHDMVKEVIAFLTEEEEKVLIKGLERLNDFFLQQLEQGGKS